MSSNMFEFQLLRQRSDNTATDTAGTRPDDSRAQAWGPLGSLVSSPAANAKALRNRLIIIRQNIGNNTS